MLKIIKSINELNFDQILAVYRESIAENDRTIYRDYSEVRQKTLSEDLLITYLKDDFFRQRDAFCAVWCVGCVYKSALRIEPYRNGVLLHALETLPEARRQGYAFSLIVSVLDYLRENNRCTVYSHVDKRNLPSLHLHKKCGFQITADSAEYIDGTVTQNSYTMQYIL